MRSLPRSRRTRQPHDVVREREDTPEMYILHVRRKLVAGVVGAIVTALGSVGGVTWVANRTADVADTAEQNKVRDATGYVVLRDAREKDRQDILVLQTRVNDLILRESARASTPPMAATPPPRSRRRVQTPVSPPSPIPTPAPITIRPAPPLPATPDDAVDGHAPPKE